MFIFRGNSCGITFLVVESALRLARTYLLLSRPPGP